MVDLNDETSRTIRNANNCKRIRNLPSFFMFYDNEI
jgi:hypothetical protein